jgi:hypothetical protein
MFQRPKNNYLVKVKKVRMEMQGAKDETENYPERIRCSDCDSLLKKGKISTVTGTIIVWTHENEEPYLQGSSCRLISATLDPEDSSLIKYTRLPQKERQFQFKEIQEAAA